MEQGYEKDWPHLKGNIEHLILSSKDFIVFIDKDLDVDWETKDAYDEKGHESVQDHNRIMNLAATLECIPSDHHPKNIRINFKRMIGEAITRSLQHDYKNADKILKGAEEYIRERNMEQSRAWYLFASGITTFIILIVGLIFWCLRQSLIPMLGRFPFFLLLSCASGASGALLSVIMRLGKSSLNCAAGKNLHYLEGFFKIIAGCISAFLVSLAIKLEMLVPIFSKVEKLHIAMLLAGLIAGASERWAPSLISKVESSNKKEQNKKDQRQVQKSLDEE